MSMLSNSPVPHITLRAERNVPFYLSFRVRNRSGEGYDLGNEPLKFFLAKYGAEEPLFEEYSDSPSSQEELEGRRAFTLQPADLSLPVGVYQWAVIHHDNEAWFDTIIAKGEFEVVENAYLHNDFFDAMGDPRNGIEVTVHGRNVVHVEVDHFAFPKLFIGEVVSVSSDSEANAELRGQYPNQTLDLWLPRGPRGYSGVPGPKGAKGDKGDIGLPGPKGDQGIPGTAAAKGVKGDTGAQGAQGLTGERGLKGDPGPQGPIGADGVAGPAGPPGPKGDKGERGATGAQGPAGEGSADISAHVAAEHPHHQYAPIVEGVLSFDTEGFPSEGYAGRVRLAGEGLALEGALDNSLVSATSKFNFSWADGVGLFYEADFSDAKDRTNVDTHEMYFREGGIFSKFIKTGTTEGGSYINVRRDASILFPIGGAARTKLPFTGEAVETLATREWTLENLPDVGAAVPERYTFETSRAKLVGQGDDLPDGFEISEHQLDFSSGFSGVNLIGARFRGRDYVAGLEKTMEFTNEWISVRREDESGPAFVSKLLFPAALTTTEPPPLQPGPVPVPETIATREWVEADRGPRIVVSPVAPADTSVVWFDTSETF